MSIKNSSTNLSDTVKIVPVNSVNIHPALQVNLFMHPTGLREVNRPCSSPASHGISVQAI